MKIGIAQINPTVGDIGGNAELILDQIREAEAKGCHLTLFPELVLTGYPPEDLLFKPSFIKDNLIALKDLAHFIKKTTALVGFVDQNKTHLLNSVAWIEDGKIKAVYHKRELPNYGVFDEQRYFTPGKGILVRKCNGIKVAVTICEDIWSEPIKLKPIKSLKPDLILNLSASPFHYGKISNRLGVAQRSGKFLKKPLLYCNMVGGQDELVFDGGSFVQLASGKVVATCPRFTIGLFIVDWDLKKKATRPSIQWESEKALTPIEEIHQALILGIRDYVNKNRFQKAAVAISGGIDSAVVAALAVQALGMDNVICVTMPSRFNQPETIKDAITLATNLGTRLIQIPIEPIFQKYLETLKPTFGDLASNIAEENLQARTRGNLIMALSNKFGWLVLTTGNKSEISTGYCTLYGDTAGGFSVLKDVLKTKVFELAHLINKMGPQDIIPKSIIERPPTAELRENQRDEDWLGPYSELDPIVVGYVEKNMTLRDLKKYTGANEDTLQKIISLIDKNEYKRRQAPPGIKITPRSFGRDHRMPITNRYKPKS